MLSFTQGLGRLGRFKIKGRKSIKRSKYLKLKMITNKKGFTLLELLIVIAIIAILSVVLIVALNPAETLRKTRDSQRISDLSSLKTALGIYVTSISSPYLGNTSANTTCKDNATTYAAGDKIWYSLSSASAITDTTLDGGTTTPTSNQVTAANVSLVDGNGWIPVKLTDITGGSPISNMPLDPVNTIADLAVVASTDLVYRYTCDATLITFEMDAQLESAAFTVTDNKRAKDGGNNANLYEVGTALNLLGTGTDF